MQPDEMVETLINTYCSAWNQPDAVQRRDTLAKVWEDDATYTDPSVHAAGIDKLSEHIATVAASRPGVSVIRTSEIKSHHGMALFAWKAILPDRVLLVEGYDFVEISDACKIRRIVGFFGQLDKI